MLQLLKLLRPKHLKRVLALLAEAEGKTPFPWTQDQRNQFVASLMRRRHVP